MTPHLSDELSDVNSDGLRHTLRAPLCNDAMRTVEEVRRLRLLQLKESSTWVKLNRLLGMDARDSTFSQIVSEKTKKEMGSDLARRVETALKKPTGWMDTDPEFDAVKWPFGDRLDARDIAALPADLLGEAIGQLKALVRENQSRPGKQDQAAA